MSRVNKWNLIVCQGSGHDVNCGQPAGYDMIIVTVLATFLTCSSYIHVVNSEDCCYDSKLSSELHLNAKRLLFSH